MKNDTIISVIVLAVLAYLFSTSNLYFFAFISLLSIVVLIYVDGSSGGFSVPFLIRSEARYDHHKNAGSYAKPMENLGRSAGESITWFAKFIRWIANPNKSNEKDKKH